MKKGSMNYLILFFVVMSMVIAGCSATKKVMAPTDDKIMAVRLAATLAGTAVAEKNPELVVAYAPYYAAYKNGTLTIELVNLGLEKLNAAPGYGALAAELVDFMAYQLGIEVVGNRIDSMAGVDMELVHVAIRAFAHGMGLTDEPGDIIQA